MLERNGFFVRRDVGIVVFVRRLDPCSFRRRTCAAFTARAFILSGHSEKKEMILAGSDFQKGEKTKKAVTISRREATPRSTYVRVASIGKGERGNSTKWTTNRAKRRRERDANSPKRQRLRKIAPRNRNLHGCLAAATASALTITQTPG